MGVELIEAVPGDREVIAALLDDYLLELADHREVPVGATEAINYPYLDVYFCESGRHPFLIRHAGQVVGFALIRAPESTGRVWEVAEFYVAPGRRSRRRGPRRDRLRLGQVRWRLGAASPRAQQRRDPILGVLHRSFSRREAKSDRGQITRR